MAAPAHPRTRRESGLRLEPRVDDTCHVSKSRDRTSQQSACASTFQQRTLQREHPNTHSQRRKPPVTSQGSKVRGGSVASGGHVCKMSMPCPRGCCYCTYSRRLGPVKIFMSDGLDPPVKERALTGIKDGNGRRSFPASRKKDVKGLVFDPRTFSFYPPDSSRGRQQARSASRSPQRGQRDDVTSEGAQGHGRKS